MSVAAIGLEENQAKYEQNYFQDQNIKVSVPKCSKVIFKMNVLQMMTIQMADCKSLFSLPLSLLMWVRNGWLHKEAGKMIY